MPSPEKRDPTSEIAPPGTRRSSPGATATRSRGLRVWRISLLVIATVLLMPGLIQFSRSQVASWKLALCYEAELEGKDQPAEEHLQGAMRWNPRDELLRNYYTSFLIRRGRAAEVLAETEAALIEARRNYEALPGPATRARLAAALNLSAYVNGLCDVNLETALERINEALKLHGNPTNSAMLDTRGYVLWRLDRHEEALTDMNAAVDEHKHDYLVSRRILQQQSNYVVDERTVTRDLRRVDEGLAALYYHRALVNQSLGLDEQAERDFQRVANLGCDPEAGVY